MPEIVEDVSLTKLGTVRKSTPGHGGKRDRAKPASTTKPTGRPTKKEQNDAYTQLAKARAKRETHKADLAELEYKKAVGELVPVAEVIEEWSNQVQIAKGRFLSLPSRLAPDLIHIEDLRTAESLLRDAIIEVLEEMADGQSTD